MAIVLHWANQGTMLPYPFIIFFFQLFTLHKTFIKKHTNKQKTTSSLSLHTHFYFFWHMHRSEPCHVFPLGVPFPWRSVACCTVVIFGTSLHFSSCTPLLYFLVLLVLSCRTAQIGYFGVIFHIWKGLCACHILTDSLRVEFKVKKHVSFWILKEILCSSLQCCY